MRKRTDGLMEEGLTDGVEKETREKTAAPPSPAAQDAGGQLHFADVLITLTFLHPAPCLSLAFSFRPSLVFFLTAPAVFGPQHVGNRFETI